MTLSRQTKTAMILMIIAASLFISGCASQQDPYKDPKPWSDLQSWEATPGIPAMMMEGR